MHSFKKKNPLPVLLVPPRRAEVESPSRTYLLPFQPPHDVFSQTGTGLDLNAGWENSLVAWETICFVVDKKATMNHPGKS